MFGEKFKHKYALSDTGIKWFLCVAPEQAAGSGKAEAVTNAYSITALKAVIGFSYKRTA